MSISLVLEVAISMVFLYLLGSQVVLSMYEVWAGYFNKRGKFLYGNLKGTLGPATTRELYKQQTISALTPSGQQPPTAQAEGSFGWRLGYDGLPAYIPADLFSSTLLALVAPAAATNNDIQAALKQLPVVNSFIPLPAGGSAPWLTQEAKQLLTQLLNGLPPAATLAECQKSVALWYDAYGERLTGWYKRRVRGWLFALGLALAVIANIDSLYILRYLWLHPQVSQAIAEKAAPRANGPAHPSAAGLEIKSKHLASPLTAASTTSDSANQNAPGSQALADTMPSAQAITRALKRTLDSANAYESKLAQLGFPVGRNPTAPVDSALLPKRFYIHQPRQTVRLGHTTYSVEEHYLYYALKDTPGKLAGGIETHSLAWTSRPMSLTNDSIKGLPDRTNVVGAAVPWLNPHPDFWWPAWVGWLLTALALSVGAPFWFDLLCRLVNIRNLGIKPPRTTQD